MRRSFLAAAAVVSISLILSASYALATDLHTYAGYQSSLYGYSGIDGYIRQSTSTTLSPNQEHNVWLEICGADCSTGEWAQMGTFQGTWRAGTSPSAVHMYFESIDACNDYYARDFGTVPLGTADQPFNIAWDGKATQRVECSNGDHKAEFNYAFRNGSFTSLPVDYGYLPTSYGDGEMYSEVVNGATIGTDYVGCDANRACSNGGYGVHTYDGTNWALWTTGAAAKSDQPPYLKSYQTYWAFASCNVAC